MTTVEKFICPVLQGKINDQDPVILESCGHTFARESVIGIVTAELEKRISYFDFRIPDLFNCFVCQTKFKIADLVVNDEWQRVSSLLKKWKQAHSEEDESNLPLSALYRFEMRERIEKVTDEWQLTHFGGDIEELSVVDYLKWKADPLVKQLFEEWQAASTRTSTDLLRLTELFDWKLDMYETNEIQVFRDIRPLHLVNHAATHDDDDKIKQAATRKPIVVSREWTHCEKLQFIASTIYHFSLGLLAEVAFFVLYFGECGLLTTAQYTALRSTYVIKHLTPIYMKYIGLPFGETTA